MIMDHNKKETIKHVPANKWVKNNWISFIRNLAVLIFPQKRVKIPTEDRKNSAMMASLKTLKVLTSPLGITSRFCWLYLSSVISFLFKLKTTIFISLINFQL